MAIMLRANNNNLLLPCILRGRKTLNGFTLIEVLIVIVIISIVSTAAVLTIRFNQNKQLETIAKQLTRTILLAEQEAMLRPATLGLGLSQNSYEFFIFNETTKKWTPLTDSNLKRHNLPNNTKLSLRMGEKNIPLDGKPHIIISSMNDISSFIIFIGTTNQARYRIIGKANGEVKNVAIP